MQVKTFDKGEVVTPDGRRLWTAERTAVELDLSLSGVERLARKGVIEPIRLLNRRLFDRAQVEALLSP